MGDQKSRRIRIGTWLKADSKMANDILVSVGIMTITTVISLLFEQLDFHESNIIILFIL